MIAVAIDAQQRRVVIGGRDSDELTKDWPTISGSGVAAIEAHVAELAKRDLFSGTVLVARDGKPVLLKSWGEGNTNETTYNIGSINKIFTRVALLQLRQQGKIDFTKTLRTVLPDYPSKIADEITIQQLIDNSSGMGDIFGPRFGAARENLHSLKDYLALFADQPLEFEPGTRRRYSNAGYIVLGLVIEKLSGMSYYDYVRERIYKPAEMKNSDSYALADDVPNRATGYHRTGEARTPNHELMPARGSSAGGGYATARDLLRFTRALPKLISRNDYLELVGDPPGIGWGGGAPGVNAVVELEGPHTIIVLSNYDPPAAQYVGRQARQALGIAEEE
jgi:CubicO group peptidase (beta-lactamase class C family)